MIDFSKVQSYYTACGYTDMRKQIDGLAALVQMQFSMEVDETSIFLFCGRRADRIKALYWDGTGYILLYKRLTEKRFQWPRNESELKKLTQQEFRWLMEGLSITQRKAFVPGKPGTVCRKTGNFPKKSKENQKDFAPCMSNRTSMKGGESSMEQAGLLVQILEEIRQQNAMLQRTIDTLREQSRQKDEEIERLRKIILNLQRAQFGQRSEKRTYVLDDGNQQLSLFDMLEKTEDAPLPEPSPIPEKEIRVSGHSRKKKRTLEELCASLPVEERIVDLPDDEKVNANGHALTCIGQEYIRTELVLERAKAKVVKHYRKVYADRELEQETGYSEVFKPVMPPPLLVHSYASASVVTDVLMKKYVDAMPLYRQEQMWKRMGVALKRGTMANWVIQVADLYLRPFWKRIRNELLTQSAIHADETVMQVHKEKGRPDTS